MDLYLNLLGDARDFAVNAHGGQMYGAFPYSKHLDDVHSVLIRFGYEITENIELHMAAFLHDTLEDTKSNFEDLESRFGGKVAELVAAVTGLGKNRKERKAMYLGRLQSYPNGIPLKVADRIANMEWSLLTNLSLLDMYVKEQTEFEVALKARSLDNGMRRDMWDHLTYLTDLGLFALFRQRYPKMVDLRNFEVKI